MNGKNGEKTSVKGRRQIDFGYTYIIQYFFLVYYFDFFFIFFFMTGVTSGS